MAERRLLIVVVLLAMLLVGLALFWQPAGPGATDKPVNPLPTGGDFSLHSAAGPLSLSDAPGRLNVVYFGYTFCPDICPTTLAALADGLQRLTAAERAQLRVIFVSVDPERDTPDHLRTYLEFFAPEMVGVTGTPAEIAAIAQRYGVVYHRVPALEAGAAYTVDHSADSFIVGNDGRLLARMPHGTPPEQVATLLRHYLSQLPTRSNSPPHQR